MFENQCTISTWPRTGLLVSHVSMQGKSPRTVARLDRYAQTAHEVNVKKSGVLTFELPNPFSAGCILTVAERGSG